MLKSLGNIHQAAKAARLDKFELLDKIKLIPESGLVTAALKLKQEPLKVVRYKNELKKLIWMNHTSLSSYTPYYNKIVNYMGIFLKTRRKLTCQLNIQVVRPVEVQLHVSFFCCINVEAVVCIFPYVCPVKQWGIIDLSSFTDGGIQLSWINGANADSKLKSNNIQGMKNDR